MQSYKTDISVLMLFHARADHFAKVWEEVKKARPARLFLYQDGPRLIDSNNNAITSPLLSKDMPGILACRSLVADENINWECEVHRNYQEKNYGCDPSGYMSQQWAFSLTDKCIVLEDDVVPSQSFFPFCKEMLDRYENDERVTMVAGFNTDEITHQITDSYFFTRVFSIWGWASWSRVINKRDANYSFVKDPEQLALLKQKSIKYDQRKDMIDLAKKHSAEGKPYFEFIFWAYMMLTDGMAIMPRVNMINNIGLEGGTHYATQLRLQPKRIRRMFEMQRYDLQFPLNHPIAISEYSDYQKRHYLRNAWNNPFRKVQYSFEELWLNLKYGNYLFILKSIRNRFRKSILKK